MKILIFGNLASGKTFLAEKIISQLIDFEYIAIDNFRRKFSDGSMEKEILAKEKFFESIIPQKNQLIEATGLGDTAVGIAQKLTDSDELKFILILKTPLKVCLKRLKKRIWNVPYPAPSQKAFPLCEFTDKEIKNGKIQDIFSSLKNLYFIDNQEFNIILQKIEEYVTI